MIYSYVFLQDNIFHYIYLSNYGMFVKNYDQIIPLNLPITEDNEQIYGQYVLYKQSNEQLKLLQCKSQHYTYTDNINNNILNIQTPANTTIVNPQITLDIDYPYWDKLSKAFTQAGYKVELYSGEKRKCLNTK